MSSRRLAGPPIAIVSPLAEETVGLLERMRDLRRERRDGRRAQVGVLGGRTVVVTSTGDGAVNAERGLRAVLDAWSPGLLLFLGVAGGLTAGLEVGQVVVGERLLDASGRAPGPDPTWSGAAGPSCPAATIFSAPRLAVTPREKASTRDGLPQGPAVVDLESTTFARIAAERNIPFAVLRAVSDRADEALPLDFNLFLDADGGVRRADVVRHVTFRPHLIPPLMDLRRRVALCAERLAAVAEGMVAA